MLLLTNTEININLYSLYFFSSYAKDQSFPQLLTNHSPVEEVGEQMTTVQQLFVYVKTVRGYGFNVAYLLTMIYLTADKLFDIQLNIR